MKLVDILARELKKWPADPEFEVFIICQDDDGSLNAYESGESPRKEYGVWLNGAFYLETPGEVAIKAELATDRSSAIVTRAEWQAAVDALNKPAWNGEGLPPIGLEIECSYPMWGYWLKGKVLCYGEQMIFMEQESSKGNGKFEGSMNPDGIMFRPIRTPEQIAAEEREEAIREMCEHGVDAGDLKIEMTVAALYDAGYRKQEQN